MKKHPLKSLNTNSLIEYFITKSLEQDKAELREEYKIWNRLYREIEEIANELKVRPGDQRRALTALYIHGNAQVRVNAAIATLAVVPVEARNALEWIGQWDVGPQRALALDMISALDSGNYVPR